MRILNLEGQYFVQAFRNLGHDVLTMGSFGPQDVLLDRPLPLGGLQDILASRGFAPDLVLWADACRPPCVIGLEGMPAVTMGYSIDQYMNPWHMPYSAAFDLILVAQKDYLDLFGRPLLSRAVAWLPLFCNPSRDRDPGLARDIPASFVGTLDGPMNQGRKAFLDEFRRRHPLVMLQGDYAPVFGRSRIVLNQSAAGELNLRLFEAAACGAAVLTEDTENGLRDLFTPGEDILVYPRGNAPAAASIARQALLDAQSLAALAAAGKRKVTSLHTSSARARHILALAETLLRQSRPSRRLEERAAIRAEVARAYAFIATDQSLPVPPELRQFFVDLGCSFDAAASRP